MSRATVAISWQLRAHPAPAGRPWLHHPHVIAQLGADALLTGRLELDRTTFWHDAQ